MAKIQILPDTLISQIAAGEVVERPASVVKELLENSLDAGAAQCTVEAEQGGMKLIAVRDNGSGMEPADARLSFARHATSKISALEDLSNLHTFGFRGEALAAIASSAIVNLKTRTAANDTGFEIIYKGGRIESEAATGCATGTEIVVRNLFFNTPARKKFLKSETTELSHIVTAVSHSALAHPHVGFVLIHNGKTLFNLPANSSVEARLSALLGKNLVSELLPVSFLTTSIKIYGFIGKPGMTQSSKRHQYLFVNGRDVSDPMVSRAVCDAYGSRLPGRQYPVFLLHIDLDPREVDSNVHPRKLMVKFLEPQRVYRDVVQAVAQAISGREEKEIGKVREDREVKDIIQQAIEFTKQITEIRSASYVSHPTLNILGQIANSYILVFEEEGLVIVDQHAAHERILYERLCKRTAETYTSVQQLLTPLTIECSREEAVFLKQTLPHLQELGFEFDEWSGNTFVVRACPADLRTENLEKIFRDFLDEMMAERKASKILPEKILKSLACKAAVKFGMPLSPQEQQQLLMDLSITPNRQTCPHGRPTRVLLTFDELERKFYRK